MGSWGVGSGDCDGAYDWYPGKLDENNNLLPPSVDELNHALKVYLKKGKVTEPYEKQEFIGVILLGFKDKVVADVTYLKLAYGFINDLLIDQSYLKEWNSPIERTQALEKERKAMMMKIFNENSKNPKLTTGLFEALSKARTTKKKAFKKAGKPVKSKFSKRPSPSESATDFKENTRKKGKDGAFWLVKVSKSKVKRWVRELKKN